MTNGYGHLRESLWNWYRELLTSGSWISFASFKAEEWGASHFGRNINPSLMTEACRVYGKTAKAGNRRNCWIPGEEPEVVQKWGAPGAITFSVRSSMVVRSGRTVAGWQLTQEYSKLNSENFQHFINALFRQLSDMVALMQLDRAPAHHSQDLEWSENIIPIFLLTPIVLNSIQLSVFGSFSKVWRRSVTVAVTKCQVSL